MKLDSKSSGDVKITLPVRRLDARSSEELKGDMEGIMGDGCRKVVANLDRVEYISSSGIRVMLASLKQLRKIDGDLLLSCLKPYVRGNFEIGGFAQLFEIYDSEDEAIDPFLHEIEVLS